MNEQQLNEIALPRLQIKCSKVGSDYRKRTWTYDLVYKHFTGDIAHVTMGVTNVEGGKGNMPIDDDGKLDLPYRDGAHIENDAVQLRLPAYAVCEDIVEKIDLTHFISQFPEKVLI